MMPARFDLLGIGNAIVDVVAAVEPGFLSARGLQPGSMSLIDADTAHSLTAAMPQGRQGSGGSVANTCAAAASLGLRVAYLGKVSDDPLGRTFRDDMAAIGVHFPSQPFQGGAPTARSLVLVTPNGQRTMNTFLGACIAFDGSDLDETLVGDSAVTYLEGYLFDPPAAQDAFRQAAAVAHRAGRKVALSLSDAFCVDRHRDAFRALVREETDILFANETEICSLYRTEDLEAAASMAAGEVALAALTRGAQGSLVLSEGRRIPVAASSATVVDTTGAGDAYAAGFLAGLALGRDPAGCGALGSLAAAEVISHYGARPETNLRALAGL